MKLELSLSQLMALRSLVAEHLLCPRRSEVYVDCSVSPSVDTTHEDLLRLLMTAPLTSRFVCQTCGSPLDDAIAAAKMMVAEGGTHDCGEWRTSGDRCALCGVALTPRASD